MQCTHCGRCKAACPHGLSQCTLCGECESACAGNTRRLCGREMTVDEIMREIIKDNIFYQSSGGGVIFSGGECMLQIDFLCELLKAAKANGLHTAVDTAGHLPFSYFERIMPYTDLFLYDIKLANPETHKAYTGVSNELILQNLKQLSRLFSGRIIIRIPVITGVNDSDREMQKIAELVGNIRHSVIELLPYHKMGEHKYAALGLTPMSFSAPSDEAIARLKAIFSL